MKRLAMYIWAVVAIVLMVYGLYINNIDNYIIIKKDSDDPFELGHLSEGIWVIGIRSDGVTEVRKLQSWPDSTKSKIIKQSKEQYNEIKI